MLQPFFILWKKVTMIANFFKKEPPVFKKHEWRLKKAWVKDNEIWYVPEYKTKVLFWEYWSSFYGETIRDMKYNELCSVYNQRGGACVGDETAYFKDMDAALRFICWYEMLREKNFETEQKLKNPYIEVRL